MEFVTHMKQLLDKTLFVEIKEDIFLNINGTYPLKKGEYPILSEDMMEIAKSGSDSIPAYALINGILHVIACDPEFKYNNDYIELLKSIQGIESYIIMEIMKVKDSNIKKAIIYATALSILYPKKENIYNRLLLLIEYYEKTNMDFIEAEIVKGLEELVNEYPEFMQPYFNLGEYYLKTDLDRAKMCYRKCMDDPNLRDEAEEILYRINRVENYDNAVELIKNGQGLEALKLLLPIINEDEENFDAKYYVAVAYRQIGNFHKALIYLNELTEFAERPEVYSEIGICLAQLGRFEEAIDYFRSALKITPDDSGILSNIGACQYSLSHVEEAKKTFSLAARINPKDEIAVRWLKKLE